VDRSLSVTSLGLVAWLALLAPGCHRTGVTRPRLERAFAETFANLIESQQALLGRHGIHASLFSAKATCVRLGPGKEDAGSGSWECTVNWSLPGRGGSLADTYELSVAPDGCYTATADAREARVGGPTRKTTDGSTIPNLLYIFDGCFDAS
jgi:ABC-2 type transport system permease protein